MDQIKVVECGGELWPRFVLRDDQCHFWTGSTWSDQASEALLFDEQHRAMKAALELTLGSKLRHFTTTVNVIVEGDEPITTEQLRRFLGANCFVWLGNDESDEAFEKLRVDVDVEWDELEEIN